MKNYLTLKNLGWVLTIIVSVMLGMAAFKKIFGSEDMVKNFEFMHLLPYLAVIGVIELLGVVLFILPKTSKYGATLLGSYLSGAVALHLSLMGGAGVLVPIVLGVGAWTGHCLRNHS